MIRALRRILAISMFLWAVPVMAHAPDASLRPLVRPEITRTLGSVRAAQEVMDLAALRPQLRPLSQQAIDAAARPDAMPFYFPDTSLRPWPRPDSVVQEALFKRRKLRKGSVCGNIDIQGDKVGRVPGKLKACGIKDAVRVRSVSGVRLSQPSLMTCDTAKSLNTWVDRGLKPAFRRHGPVVEMKVAAHYACRTRNNQRGAKISEHGKGKAIDLSAFVMKDGDVITVLKGWRHKSTRAVLSKAYKAACGPFGTTLGPNADRYHQDHFHFDTAKHRSGPYCR